MGASTKLFIVKSFIVKLSIVSKAQFIYSYSFR